MYWFAWACWWLALLVVAAGITVWLRRTGEFLAPIPIVLGSIGLYAIPRSWHLLFFQEAPLTSGGLFRAEQQYLIAMSLLLVAVGVMTFLLGFRARKAVEFGKRIRFSLPEPDPTRAWPVAILLGAAGFTALAMLIRGVGGVSYAMAHQAQMPELFKGKGLLVQLIRLSIVPIGILFLKPGTQRMRVIPWVLALVAMLGLSVLGRRSFIVEAASYPILLYHLCIRRFPLRYVMGVGIPAALGLIAVSYIRLLGAANLGATVQLLRKYPELLSRFLFGSSGEFAIFDSLTILIRDVPDHFAFNYGASFLRVPFMLIPRSLWYDKPASLPVEITQRYLPYIKAGYPPMILGELYVVAGVFMVIIGMFLWGGLCRAGWEWHQRHPGVGNATIYIMFCSFVFDWTRVGDASRSILFFLIVLGFFTFAFGLAGPQRRRAPMPALDAV